MEEVEVFLQREEIKARIRLDKFMSFRGKTKNIGKLEAIIFSRNSRLEAVRGEMLKHCNTLSA